MLKYTKGLEIGVTFFALWVLMMNAHIPLTPALSDEHFYSKDSNTIHTYKPYSTSKGRLIYYKTKEDCNKRIKRSYSKGYKATKRPTLAEKGRAYDRAEDLQIANGFCVKASDL